MKSQYAKGRSGSLDLEEHEPSDLDNPKYQNFRSRECEGSCDLEVASREIRFAKGESGPLDPEGIRVNGSGDPEGGEGGRVETAEARRAEESLICERTLVPRSRAPRKVILEFQF
jgi:hypothetical protein